MDEYYRILELSPSADAMQVKKAYRRLAMLYHPDVNTTEAAHEKFIQITEAYEILTGARRPRQSASGQSYRTSQYAPPDYRYDPQKHREKFAQRRAERMKYSRFNRRYQGKFDSEEFFRQNAPSTDSWYYRPVQILVYLASLVGVGFGVFLMLSPVLLGVYFYINGQRWWFGALCVPLMGAGIQVIYQSILLKKETAPYFHRKKETPQ